MAKIKIKTPSKAQLTREFRRAFTKNLRCPQCGRNIPTTTMSSVTCPGCRLTIKL